MFNKRIDYNKDHVPFIKFRNNYFIPLDLINYLEAFALFFFVFLLFILGIFQDKIFYVFSLLSFLFFMSYIKNRFLKSIQTNKSKKDNIQIIEQLALKQINKSQFNNTKGLYAFEYEMQSKTFIKKYQNRFQETIIIYCEDNKIWIGSLKNRNQIFNFFSNKSKWINLIYLQLKN